MNLKNVKFSLFILPGERIESFFLYFIVYLPTLQMYTVLLFFFFALFLHFKEQLYLFEIADINRTLSVFIQYQKCCMVFG